MFRTHNSRARRAERVAGQAWSNLVAAVGDAGTAARSATRRTMHNADGMGGRVSGATREARRRASRAYDALAGRPAPRPWAWLAAAGAVGVVVGWVGTVFGRQLAVRGDELALQRSVNDHVAEKARVKIP
jgi:hypothetical protein